MELDYRNYLNENLNARRTKGTRVTLAELAQAAGIQAPYLSKVLAKKAHLTQDQLYLISQALKLNTRDEKFVFLLLDYTRCDVMQRKEKLKQQIERYQQKYYYSTESQMPGQKIEDVEAAIGAQTQYYLDPIPQLLYVALTIEKYQKKPELLATELGLPTTRITQALNVLESLDLARFSIDPHRKWISSSKNLHLSKTSPLYKAQQNQFRVFSASRLQGSNPSDTYCLQISFSADRKARLEIQKKFLEFLKEFDRLVDRAPSEEIYQMNFDLFGWG
mgnify:CR=1 FL=1